MQVTVNTRGTVVITHAQLVANRDVPTDTVATTRYPDGHQESGQRGGTSAKELATLAHVPLTAVRSMTIADPDDPGGSVTLGPEEVELGISGGPDGTRQATFSPDYQPSEAQFFRPMRFATDVNSGDILTTAVHNDLHVDIETTGQRAISVGAEPEKSSVNAGDSVGFHATQLSDVTYVWDFGDGTPTVDGGPDIAHVYTTAGAWDASVTVIAGDGSSAVSNLMHMVVDAAPGGTATTPSAPADAAAGGSGGNGGGGGQAATGGGKGGKHDTSTGARKGASQGTVTPTDGGKSAATGSAGESTKSSKAEAKARPATQTAAAQAPAAPASTGTPAAASSPTTHGRSRSDPARRAAPSAAGATPVAGTAGGGGARVAGTVVAGTGGDLSAALTAAEALASDPKQGPRVAARAAAGHGGRPLGWVGGGGALLGLLALGALREGVRGSRRPRLV